MTDEERRKLVEKLKESTGMQVSYWTCLRAANEIERLAKELEEAKRHDMRDWYDALEQGRKNPI